MNIDASKKQGKEILDALKTKFPFTRKVLENIPSLIYPQFISLLGAYSKEGFLKAFEKNYIDLIKKVVSGLEEEEPIVVGALHRTLFGQKDFFESNIYFITFPPRYPDKYCEYKGVEIIVRNGYENLALDLIKKLPKEASEVYFDRYKNDHSKLLDLRLASLYYKHAKSLGKYDEKTLNSLLDTIEKTIRQGRKEILEAWL